MWTVAPMDEQYLCTVATLPSLWPPPPPSPLSKLNGLYSVCDWGEGRMLIVELCCRPYSAVVLYSVSGQIQNLQNCYTTPNKWPVKTTWVCVFKFLRPWWPPSPAKWKGRIRFWKIHVEGMQQNCKRKKFLTALFFTYFMLLILAIGAAALRPNSWK